MADPFAIMTPGQSLESGVGPFNREWHNAMTDLHQRTVRNRASDMTQGEAQLPEDTKIWIANVEGTILPRYSAIGISPILLTYPGEHTDFTRRLCFITTPLVRGRPFAILQKTLHANETYIAKTAIAADEQQPPTTEWVRLIGEAGAYDSTAHYAIGEQVTSGGTTYAAIQPVDGESLSNTSYWLPLGPRRGMWDGTAYAAGDVVAIPTLGEILISGHSRCTVTVGHASHNYAGISDLGIVSQADPGPLEIISKDGTGEQSCIVRFCCDVISNPSCTGTGALSLPTLTTAGAGIRYGGDLITGVMTLAGVGTFSPPVCTGEDGPTLAALTISGSGKVYDPNPSGRLYFGPMTLAGSGTVTNPPSGFAWIPFATMTLAGSGTVDPPTCTGSGAMTFGALNIDGGGLWLSINALKIFKTIAVSGQSDVVADSATDTLTLAAGSNIAITTNASTDTVTIAATGVITSVNSQTGPAITHAVGTSGTDHNIAASGDTITHNIPNASLTARGVVTTTTQTIGGVKTFNDLVIASDGIDTADVYFPGLEKTIYFGGSELTSPDGTLPLISASLVTGSAGLIPRPTSLSTGPLNLADCAYCVWITSAGPESPTLMPGLVSQCFGAYDYFSLNGGGWVSGSHGVDAIGNIFVGGICVSPRTSTLTVSIGGTGATSFTSGSLIVGNGTSALSSVATTRVSGGNLQLKLASDSWIEFGEASF